MDEWKLDICIHHASCDDGFGAAWAIWKRFGDSVAYIPGVYGTDLPDVAGKNVLFVDYSGTRPEIDAMAQVAKSIVIVDHHKSAFEELTEFAVTIPGGGALGYRQIDDRLRDLAELNRPPVIAWFDMGHSGAVMAWRFAMHEQPLPLMLSLIEDHDLWRFVYGDKTKQFSAALRTYAMTFAGWDMIERRVDEVVAEGAIILRAHNVNIDKFLADVTSGFVAGHRVPMVNVPHHYASGTAHAMLERYPDAPFTAAWFKRGDGKLQFSLRSEDSRMDVSEVAKAYGGGGHRNAAGFQVDEYDETQPYVRSTAPDGDAAITEREKSGRLPDGSGFFITEGDPDPNLPPVRWNPFNKVVQDHRNGAVDLKRTDEERAKRGLPVPWKPEMADTEAGQSPVE